MANFLTKIFGGGKSLEKRGHLPYSSNPYSLQRSLSEIKNGSLTYADFDNATDIAEALENCPAVAYIINKKARAFCSGIITALKVSTMKPVSGLLSVYQELIDKPNFIQTGYQFKMQNYAQMQAYGYSVCLKIKAAGIISSIWALPNEELDIEWEPGWTPFKRKDILSAIKSIRYAGGEIDKNDVYIFTDSTPCDNGVILPVSRLKPLKHQIRNLIVNYESRGRLMNKPMGILTSNFKDNISAMDMDPDDIEKLHQDFDKYGLSKAQRRFIITSANMDWKPISFPLSDMQMDIFEKNDTITIAEGLDYPPFLLGISDKGIYNNVSEAQKGLYTSSIIPDGENYVQQLVQCFNADKAGVTYAISFKHLAVLQEGLKAMNEARKIFVDTVTIQFEKNQISYGRLMELLEEPYINTEWKDLLYFEMPYNKQEQQTTTDETPKPKK